MANYFVNLPAAQAPSNAMLNFQPLAQAVAGIRERNQQAEVDSQNAMLAQNREARAAETHQMRKQEYSQGQRDRTMQKLLGVVQMVDQEQDENARATKWQKLIGAQPAIAKSLKEHGLDPTDYMEGPRAIIASQRGYVEPKEAPDMEFKTVGDRGYAFDPRTGQARQVVSAPAADPNEATAGKDLPAAVRSVIEKADLAYSNLVPALDDYAETVAKTGANLYPGEEKDEVLRKRRNIQLQMKELFNLGVLNGPDLELMDNMLFNPNIDSIGEISNAYDTKNRAQRSVNDLKDMLRNMRNTYTSKIGRPDAPPFEQASQEPAPMAASAAGSSDQGQEYPVLSPEQAAQQPPGTLFRTTDGRLKRVPGGQSDAGPQAPQGR